MIEKLTDKQSARMAEFREKWTEIGLSTTRANRTAAESWCRKAYKEAGLKEPKIIFWAESPMGLLLTGKLIKEIAAKGLKPYSEMDLEKASVRDSVWDSVGDSVGDSVWASVRDSGLRSEWNECCSWGQHDANWLGFYDYFREVLSLEKETKKLIPLTELAKETGWHLFYKNIAILSEKPCDIHRNPQGRLHNFDAAAIKWKDGYELFRFNGIIVTKEQAELTRDKFTKQNILNEKNGDVRRELVRKIGNERAIEILDAKTLDEKHGYKLLSLDLGDKRERPYLWMKNPSIDAVHVEGVAPNIKTVEQALAWRNGLETYVKPFQLT